MIEGCVNKAFQGDARSLVAAVWLRTSILFAAASPSPPVTSATAVGIWLMGTTVAIEMFDCGSKLCGHVVWLKNWRDALDSPRRDSNNPDPALRLRPMCGPTIIWDLHR